jgi:CrcB protein
VIAVVAAGGSVGAAARYGVGVALPTPASGFPTSILVVNTLGCALIGVLMVLTTEVWGVHRLIRPLLGTGVLGGFTTFSTYAVGIQHLVTVGAPRTALFYLVATPVAALAAVWAAVIATRAAMKGRRHEAHR